MLRQDHEQLIASGKGTALPALSASMFAPLSAVETYIVRQQSLKHDGRTGGKFAFTVVATQAGQFVLLGVKETGLTGAEAVTQLYSEDVRQLFQAGRAPDASHPARIGTLEASDSGLTRTLCLLRSGDASPTARCVFEGFSQRNVKMQLEAGSGGGAARTLCSFTVDRMMRTSLAPIHGVMDDDPVTSRSNHTLIDERHLERQLQRDDARDNVLEFCELYSGALQLNLQSGLLTPFQGLGFALSVLSSRGFLEPKMLKRLRA